MLGTHLDENGVRLGIGLLPLLLWPFLALFEFPKELQRDLPARHDYYCYYYYHHSPRYHQFG